MVEPRPSVPSRAQAPQPSRPPQKACLYEGREGAWVGAHAWVRATGARQQQKADGSVLELLLCVFLLSSLVLFFLSFLGTRVPYHRGDGDLGVFLFQSIVLYFYLLNFGLFMLCLVFLFSCLINVMSVCVPT